MKRFAAVVALATVAAPAFAGGPVAVSPEPEVVVAPVVVVKPDGNWAGFYAGANIGYGDFDAESTIGSASADGAIGGVQAGYRWDFGTTVLGVELAYSGSDVKDDSTGFELKNKTDLKLQLGYDMGQSLLYATAGYSHAKASLLGTDYSDDGYVVGLGYDYAINSNWTVGGEYLYSKYDDFDGTGVDLDGNSFALRVNYKF